MKNKPLFKQYIKLLRKQLEGEDMQTQASRDMQYVTTKNVSAYSNPSSRKKVNEMYVVFDCDDDAYKTSDEQPTGYWSRSTFEYKVLDDMPQNQIIAALLSNLSAVVYKLSGSITFSNVTYNDIADVMKLVSHLVMANNDTSVVATNVVALHQYLTGADQELVDLFNARKPVYFSQSKNENVVVGDMAGQYLINAFNKKLCDFDKLLFSTAVERATGVSYKDSPVATKITIAAALFDRPSADKEHEVLYDEILKRSRV